MIKLINLVKLRRDAYDIENSKLVIYESRLGKTSSDTEIRELYIIPLFMISDDGYRVLGIPVRDGWHLTCSVITEVVAPYTIDNDVMLIGG